MTTTTTTTETKGIGDMTTEKLTSLKGEVAAKIRMLIKARRRATDLIEFEARIDSELARRGA